MSGGIDDEGQEAEEGSVAANVGKLYQKKGKRDWSLQLYDGDDEVMARQKHQMDMDQLPTAPSGCPCQPQGRRPCRCRRAAAGRGAAHDAQAPCLEVTVKNMVL